jgi:uncharacterized delta-60 repeat protein
MKIQYMNKFLSRFSNLFYIFLLFLASSRISFSQQDWIKNFGGIGDDKAYAITVDKFGYIYVTGYLTTSGANTQIVTYKLRSADGSTVWSRIYNGPTNIDDRAYAIKIDKLNNVIVAGYTTAVGTHHDFTTIEYNSDGVQQWVYSYNAPLNGDDEAHALVCDDSSNVYVTGFITNVGTDYYTAKYNKYGIPQWAQVYNGTANGEDKAYAIAIDKYSNIYVTGYTRDTGSGFDYTTIKYNTNGVQQWVKTYNGTGNGEDKAYAITIDKLGSIYVTGYSMGINSSFDIVTLKYDSTGNNIWTERYDGTGHSEDKAYAITVDSMNNVYVTGSSRHDTVSGTEDYVIIKYNGSNGDSMWVQRYGSIGKGGPSIPYSINIPKNNSAVFVTGSSWTDSIKRMDIATVKYSLNGEYLQDDRINGSGNGDDVALMIASDTLGNIFLTGYESISGDSNDIFVNKYHLGSLIGITTISTEIPAHFKLYQNYPNPFNPATKIKFEISTASIVKLKIYDILGREVTTLLNKYLNSGVYETDFSTPNLSSGVYFYELSAQNFRDVKKLVIIK